MAKREKPEVIGKDGRVSLWFPDSKTPALRSFPADSDIEMTMNKVEDGWGIYVGLDGAKPTDAVAVYENEEAATDALSRTAMVLGGYKPKDAWWYARWTSVFMLLGVIASMEVYFAITNPEDLIAGDAISSPGASYGALGGSSLPSTSFGGGTGQAAAAPPVSGGYGALPSAPGPGAIAATPSTSGIAAPNPGGVQLPKQPGGLSAFGLDDRSPPAGSDGAQNPLFNLDN